MKNCFLLPVPRRLTPGENEFRLSDSSRIVAESSAALSAAELLAEYLRPATGYLLPVTIGHPGEGDVVLMSANHEIQDEDGFFIETHTISVTQQRIVLRAENHWGLCRAIQTLRQLFPPEIYSDQTIRTVEWKVPETEIFDTPEYRWRGMHLDVGRHFFSEQEVCRFIEEIAQHKFNMFHWHLTEDQGWRLEIKRYPRLTEIGAWREETVIGHDGHDNDRPCTFDGIPYGGFYSQEAVRRVVAFAARRGITVMPEIDMPGHAQAAVAAYPKLGNNPEQPVKVWTQWGVSDNVMNAEPETFDFLKNILSEVLELFPSRYIHIGGDEASRKQWENNPRIEQRMRERGCSGFDALQGEFAREIGEFLRANNRLLIGWDELIRCGLPENAAVMKAGRIIPEQSGFKMVNASNEHAYLDHYQGDPQAEPLAFGGRIPCELAYDFHPAPLALPQEQKRWILGGQGQLWTEYMPDFRHVEYMAWPRACALAERLWSREDCNYSDFRTRWIFHRKRLEQQNIHFHPER